MPGNELSAKPPELTAAQRSELVAAIQQDPYVGHVKAARAAGIAGSAGQIRQLLAEDEEFQEALAEARRSLITKAGLTFEHLLTKLASIIDDDDNASQLRAVERGFAILGHPIKDGGQDVTVTHSGEVRNPDVAAAVERLNALVAAAAVRHAAGSAPGGVTAVVDAGGTSRPGLPVAKLDRPA